MKKKTIKKIWKSALSLIGILALALIVFSSYAIIYTHIYEHPYIYFLTGLGVCVILVLLGATSWRKIKTKIWDIFT